MSSDKQLHYSSRTFDIIPNSIVPRNLNLERGAFNQVSEFELKNPQHIKDMKNIANKEKYMNPYAITHIDFSSQPNINTRKVDKRNRTNIVNERLDSNSQYMNQKSQNTYSDRFHQIDQKNINSDKFKHIKVNENPSFQEYLDFKKSMNKSQGEAKY